MKLILKIKPGAYIWFNSHSFQSENLINFKLLNYFIGDSEETKHGFDLMPQGIDWHLIRGDQFTGPS